METAEQRRERCRIAGRARFAKVTPEEWSAMSHKGGKASFANATSEEWSAKSSKGFWNCLALRGEWARDHLGELIQAKAARRQNAK